MTKGAVMRRFSIALVLVGALGAASAPGAIASGWSLQHSPVPPGGTNIYLFGVACPSERVCTAVGYYYNGTKDVTLAERWNGTKWSVQHTPNPAGATSSELDGISCASGSACIAVGDYGNGTAQVTLAERWNGTKWSIQSPPTPLAARASH